MKPGLISQHSFDVYKSGSKETQKMVRYVITSSHCLHCPTSVQRSSVKKGVFSTCRMSISNRFHKKNTAFLETNILLFRLRVHSRHGRCLRLFFMPFFSCAIRNKKDFSPPCVLVILCVLRTGRDV